MDRMFYCWMCVLNSQYWCLCYKISRKWPSKFLSSLILWHVVCIPVSHRTACAVAVRTLSWGFAGGWRARLSAMGLFHVESIMFTIQPQLLVMLLADQMWVWIHWRKQVLCTWISSCRQSVIVWLFFLSVPTWTAELAVWITTYIRLKASREENAVSSLHCPRDRTGSKTTKYR